MNWIEIDTIPERNLVWDTVSTFADDELRESDFNTRPPHPYRELWYCPTVTIWDAHRAEKLCAKFDIERVYDLGAGDLRFSLWMADRGYDVVAYELNENLTSAVAGRFPLGDIDLRTRDYYEDYDDLIASDAAVVAFGGTNELPRTPTEGLGIQGYAETGRRVWYAGEVIGGW